MGITKLTNDIIGWKVAFIFTKNSNIHLSAGITSPDGKERYGIRKVLVKLRIRKGATVVDSNSTLSINGMNKRRCSSAEVIGIYTLNEKCRKLSDSTIARSVYRPTFKYYVGKKVVPSKPLDRNTEETCGSGIHFFDHKSEALLYSDWYSLDTWPWCDITERCNYHSFNFNRFNAVLAFTRKLYEEQVAGRKGK